MKELKPKILNHENIYNEVDDVETHIFNLVKTYCETDDSIIEDENIYPDSKKILDLSFDTITTDETFVNKDELKFKISQVFKENIIFGARILKSKMMDSYIEMRNENSRNSGFTFKKLNSNPKKSQSSKDFFYMK